MEIARIWLWSSVFAAVIMAWVSFLGISSPETYSQETANWAAQAIGQDYVNLFLAAPLLLMSAYLADKGSLRAYLVWLGTSIYVAYSYVLYSFFVHFGPNFLLYVATLGLACYSMFGSLASLDRDYLSRVFAAMRPGSARIVLGVVGVIFYLLWLSDIAKAIASGSLPAGVADIGFAVNPVHVLDMAFILPGSLITSYLLAKKKTAGYLFAVPLLVFFVLMGAAIISMFQMMAAKGFPAAPAQSMMMGAITAVCLVAAYDFLKGSEKAKV